MERKDRFAPIRSLWDTCIDRCGHMYVPGPNLTIVEQLLGFRGRCPFCMYIPGKSTKYRLKLALCNDSDSNYLLGVIPYLGRQEPPPQGNLSMGHYFTKELTRPYHQSHRNVTIDNWFTSVPLASDLISNCGITLVGTIRSDKEIPQMKEVKERIQGYSCFLHTKNMTLVSYVATTMEKKLVLSPACTTRPPSCPVASQQ